MAIKIIGIAGLKKVGKKVAGKGASKSAKKGSKINVKKAFKSANPKKTTGTSKGKAFVQKVKDKIFRKAKLVEKEKERQTEKEIKIHYNPYNPNSWIPAIAFITYEEDDEKGDLIEYFASWPNVDGALIYIDVEKTFFESYLAGRYSSFLKRKSWGSFRKYNIEGGVSGYEGAPLKEVAEQIIDLDDAPEWIKTDMEALYHVRFPTKKKVVKSKSKLITYNKNKLPKKNNFNKQQTKLKIKK